MPDSSLIPQAEIEINVPKEKSEKQGVSQEKRQEDQKYKVICGYTSSPSPSLGCMRWRETAQEQGCRVNPKISQTPGLGQILLPYPLGDVVG